MYGDESYIAHHGVKGQKWGVRRYQNEDGTLINPKGRQSAGPKKESPEDAQRRKDTAKKVIIGAAGVALAGLAIYGAYKAGGKLKTDMVNQALNARKEAAEASWAYSTLGDKYKVGAKLARSGRNRTLLDGNERLANEYNKEMHYNMRQARTYSQQSSRYAAKARHYGDVALSTTRVKATKNWIKNRGRINIDNL